MRSADTRSQIAPWAEQIVAFLRIPDRLAEVRSAVRAVGLEWLGEQGPGRSGLGSQELPRLSERRDWTHKPLTARERLVLIGVVHDAHFEGTGVKLVNPWLADPTIDFEPVEWLSNLPWDPKVLGSPPKGMAKARTGPFPRRALLNNWWMQSLPWLRDGGLTSREWVTIREAVGSVEPTRPSISDGDGSDLPALTADQYEVLKVLDKERPRCLTIADVVVRGPSRNRETVCRLLRELEKLGFAHRPHGLRRGRTITMAGHELLASVSK